MEHRAKKCKNRWQCARIKMP